MIDPELAAKQSYFEEQKLLDISDDETSYNDEIADKMERAMADVRAPRLSRQPSSFLGPTPKEAKADFEAHTIRRRAVMRDETKTLARSDSASRAELTQSLLVTKPQARQLSMADGNAESNRKRVTSLPNINELEKMPFYQKMGVVPRQLRNERSVKPAYNIELHPESKQLLRGKIIYFYPNDDISMMRRTRIHKVIQLGAAWVNKWRDDITHILVDDANYTYTQLLRHFNRAGFPKTVVLAKFDPYIPQCIQFGALLNPSAARFSVKDAPRRGEWQIADTIVASAAAAAAATETSDESHTSFKIKSPKKRKDAVPSQSTDPAPTKSTPSQAIEKIPESPSQERVKDSFVMSASDAEEESAKLTDLDTSIGDGLLQAIRETKAIAHLPIDDDEDEISPTPSVIGVDDIDLDTNEPLGMPTKSLKRTRAVPVKSAFCEMQKKGLNQNGFRCMDPSTGQHSSQNPNARTIQILEEMGRHYDQTQDQWRMLAYRRCITTLKKQTRRISTAKEAAALPFIGSRLAEKIEEIVLTNRLRKLDNTKDDPLNQVLRLFLGVYGAGLIQANTWIRAGYRTLEDLISQAKLTNSQKVGLEHYNDFNSRIPRTEVAAHGAVIIKALKKIDSNFEAILMGSYRRGAEDSGDIDIIITRKGASLSHIRTVVFNTLIPHLFQVGFLKVSLATIRSNNASGTKWHGASCLPGAEVWRRMDLLVVPEYEMGAALVYFTGNDIFNRSMRLLARKKGMRLNQKGLYKDVKRGRRGERLNDGVLVEGRSERKIFEILGVPWREPHERTC